MECDLLPNDYMLSTGWDHTLELVPQGDLAPGIPSAHYLFFPSSFTTGILQALETSQLLWGVCERERERASVPEREIDKQERLLGAQALLVQRKRKGRAL